MVASNKGKEGEYLLNDWISLYNGYVKVSSDVSPKDEQVPDGPKDLTDIAKASKPENYIAFIYADGNNMGRIFGKYRNTCTVSAVFRTRLHRTPEGSV